MMVIFQAHSSKMLCAEKAQSAPRKLPSLKAQLFGFLILHVSQLGVGQLDMQVGHQMEDTEHEQGYQERDNELKESRHGGLVLVLENWNTIPQKTSLVNKAPSPPIIRCLFLSLKGRWR